MGDLWEFDLSAREWTEVRPAGPAPQARFLFSLGHYSPELLQNQTGTPNSLLTGVEGGPSEVAVLFGGEASSQCYMNDVWEYRIEKQQWREVSPATACEPRCKAVIERGRAQAGGREKNPLSAIGRFVLRP